MTVYDGPVVGGALEGSFTVNQQAAPTADATLGGRPFQSLGTFQINSASASVRLTDQANGYVIADAVQFLRVGDLLPTELTVAIALEQASERGVSVGATVTRTGSTAADLVVSLTSSDTTEATVPSTVTIASGAASATFAVTLVDDALADGTQTVTIQAAGGATVFPGSDTLQVLDNEVIDDGDLVGYSEDGTGWVSVPGSASYPGYGDDWRYHAAGSGGNVARWSSAGLPAGQYQVLVTWSPASNRATNAPYTVYDGVAPGGTFRGTFALNQQQAPAADVPLGGRPFQRLGTFTIGSGTARVELSDNADGYVIADAVLILPANPLRAAGGAALGASVASLTAEQARPLLAEAARVGKRRAWVGPRRRTCS